MIGNTLGHLYQSEFFREVLGNNNGPPPEVNLFNEKNNGLAVQKIISKGLVNSVHDISSGGILISLAEMCISGNIGVKIKIPRNDISPNEYLFGEDQSRYLIELDKSKEDEVFKILKKSSIYYEKIGHSQKERLELDNEVSIKLDELNKLNSGRFKNYFNEN